MEKLHDISDFKFKDSFLVVTIDEEPKRFELNKVEKRSHNHRLDLTAEAV